MTATVWVYVATRHDLDGIVKIGKTDRKPSKRMSELSSTEMVHDYVLQYAGLFAVDQDIERVAHKAFAHLRVRKDRGERLIDLMGNRARKLAQHRNPHQVGDLLTLQLRFGLGGLPVGDVHEKSTELSRPSLFTQM